MPAPAKLSDISRGALPAPNDLTTAPALVLGDQEWSRRPDPDAAPLNLSAGDKAQAEHRFKVIEPLISPNQFATLWAECKGRKLAVVERISVEQQCRTRTIRHWVTRYKRHGLMGLVNRDRVDKGISRKLNKAAKEQTLALAIPKRGAFGALSVSEIYRAYDEERAWRDERIAQVLRKEDAEKYARYVDADGRLTERARLPQVSSMTLRRFVESIPEAVRTLARDGEEAYRNTQEIISHRAIREIDPLQYVVMDHRVLDVFARTPGKGCWMLVRPWITCSLDMRTRRWLAWGLFETPSSDSIATILKKTFIEHGVPQNVYWDNGKDFRAEYFEGKRTRKEASAPVGELDTAWRGVLGTLGVRITHALAYNARAKIIEPNFNRIANFDATLPEFCGHRSSARPERLELMVQQHQAWERGERAQSPFRTIQEMAALYDAAIRDLNERPLQGDGMQKATPTGRGWMTPAECWDLLIGRIERRTVRTEDLHVVFTKRRTLTVKHGEIAVTFDGQKFHYRMDGDPLQLMGLNGQLVEVAYDPQELEQLAVYWRDRFICIAHCVALRRMGEDAFVEDEKKRRATRREVRKAIGMIHQAIPVASPEERLSRRREVVPARLAAFASEVPAQLPAAVSDAAAAITADQQFLFAECRDEIPASRPVAEAVDDAFNFFSDQGAKS